MAHPRRGCLYLVDAHAYIHRAYHALPPLTNSRGEPVGALFGFARMLLQLVKKEKPEGIAVCFDTPEPTFRHKASEAYKATRKEIDADLKTQLGQAQAMAEAMGFACAALPGYEADDVMATLARRSSAAGFDAVLVTGDKDALQMVSPGIRVLNVAKNVWMDALQVEEKFGVPPEAIVDYLTIIGDASDNVAGIRGIGPVGASKILKQYKTLKAALKAAKDGDPEMAPKWAKALLASEAEAQKAASLIKLEDNAPVGLSPKDCALQKPEPEALKEVLGRLEFFSLLKELLPGEAVPEPAANQSHAAAASGVPTPVPASQAVLSLSTFSKLSAELAKASAIVVGCALNAEHDLAEPSRYFLALGFEDGRMTVLAEDEVEKNEGAIRKVLKGSALKSVYDLKETSIALALAGLELSKPIFDTMLAAYVLNPTGLKAQSAGVSVEALLEGQGPKGRRSALERAALALGAEALSKLIKEGGLSALYEDMELPLVEVLQEMEAAGIAVDRPYLSSLSTEFEGRLAGLKGEIDEMAGAPINVNSSKQLGELLYDRLGLPSVRKTAKGGRSTDEESLKALAAANPIPGKVLEYREISKLKSTYIDGLLERVVFDGGRVHTHFDQTGTATGRLSSLDPNLQNIPIRSPLGQKIRRAFVAAPGSVLLSVDYSQIDLRVLAHMSGDKVLKEAFERGEDIHTRTACEVFHVEPAAVDKEMRRGAKAINFGIVYGLSAHGLSMQLGIPYGKAAEYIRHYFERYEGVAAWIKRNVEQAKRDGFVRTLSGRIRYLPELSAKNAALRQFGERAAGNTPIQGGSADVIKHAMLKVHEVLSADKKFKAKMLLQIHDELVFEVPCAELKGFAAWVKPVMERAVALSVPLVVDLKAGDNWQDMAPVEKIPAASESLR